MGSALFLSLRDGPVGTPGVFGLTHFVQSQSGEPLRAHHCWRSECDCLVSHRQAHGSRRSPQTWIFRRWCKVGRGDRIRTCDPLFPKQMRYQAAPLPEPTRPLEIARYRCKHECRAKGQQRAFSPYFPLSNASVSERQVRDHDSPTCQNRCHDPFRRQRHRAFTRLLGY